MANENEVRYLMIESAAAFFGVSISACRKRFIELGYSEMRGIFVFIDGHYVPPFRYAPASLQKNQTYIITTEQAKALMEKNPKLSRMVTKGRVRFVENHFVINHPDFVNKDCTLTDEARNHLEKCALKVDLVYPHQRFTRSHNNTDGGIYRTVESTLPLNVLYAQNNETFEEAAKRIAAAVKVRDADVGEVVENMPESFPKALRNVIAWTEKTEEQFALEAEITPKTLSRLLSGETQKPTPQQGLH